jgi:3-oxoadipate enol-lactonase
VELLKHHVNGFEMAYEQVGNGEPLLLIHGFPLDHRIWKPLIPLLRSNFTLLMPDLSGFGESDLIESNYSITSLADDLRALMDLLNIKKAWVAGHSMGGYVSLAFAEAFPNRLLGLGLISSHPMIDSKEKQLRRENDAQQVEREGVNQIASSMALSLTSKFLLQEQLKVIIEEQKPAAVAAALRAMARRTATIEVLRNLTTPKIIIHGLLDKVIPVSLVREVQAMARGSQLIELPDSGHMPMMESPTETAQAIKLFS